VTREEWLAKAAGPLSALLVQRAHVTAPQCYLSVGWPKSKPGKGRKVLGECWNGARSEDGAPHIFLTPEMKEVVQVLATLLHELVHAAVEPNLGEGKRPVGHKGAFVKAAKAAGLLKPWTATTPDDGLVNDLQAIAEALGPYPHAVLTQAPRGTKKTGRLRLYKCQCEPPVKVRVARDADRFHATCDDCCATFRRKEEE